MPTLAKICSQSLKFSWFILSLVLRRVIACSPKLFSLLVLGLSQRLDCY